MNANGLRSKIANGEGGRKKRAEELIELRRENEELRSKLGLRPSTYDEVDVWERSMGQEVRDRMVARALIMEWGRTTFALRRLGFDVDVMTPDQKANLADRLFMTEGVQAIVNADLSDMENSKTRIIQRTTEIALHGDDDASTRASTLLAKMAGWQKTPDTVIDNRSISLYQLAGGGAARKVESDSEVKGAVSGMDFLSHEPGEAETISMDDDAMAHLQGTQA